MEPDNIVIEQTRQWIEKVVVDCNFCPFAGKELKRGTIHYRVVRSREPETILQSLSAAFDQLDSDSSIETTLIVLPEAYTNFNDYLDLVELCEEFLVAQEKEGIYQVASFHPQYLFEGSTEDDPANYTNRSPYPMIHLLREAAITNALENFPDPENIPEKNIEFAQRKGLAYMKSLRDSCFFFLFFSLITHF